MPFSLDADKDWLVNVRKVPSPNCDERAGDTIIDAVVVHGISLPPKQYGGPYIEQFFTNTLDHDVHPYFSEIKELRVSSHLLVNRAGDVIQFVPFSLRARHAGVSQLCGRDDCNEYSIGIELEGCDDEPYEDIQYKTLAEIVKSLMKQWPEITSDRIVGHSDIAPDRKTDPGPVFDWEYFFTLLT